MLFPTSYNVELSCPYEKLLNVLINSSEMPLCNSSDELRWRVGRANCIAGQEP
jgi:hypothetical protein